MTVFLPCSIPPVYGTDGAIDIEVLEVGVVGGAFVIIGIVSPSEPLSVVQGNGTLAGCLMWHSR